MDMTYDNVNSRFRRPLMLASVAVAMLIGGTALNAQGFAGKVIDESGKPLGGVFGNYVRVPKRVRNLNGGTPRLVVAPGEPLTTGTVQSNADGTFPATGIPPGNYILCILAPSDSYADPCVWNKGRVWVTVQQTGTTTVDPITIWAGVKVHFSIADPQGLLPSGQELAPTAVVGVLTRKGVVRRATAVSRSTGVVDAVIIIPHDESVSLWAASATLKFTDVSGKPVTAAVPSPITPVADASDHIVRLSVTK
jgi:hypothetical protein